MKLCYKICSSYSVSMMSALITVCLLILGDAAVGDGVTRHFFSIILEKLKYGFSLNLGMQFISCTVKCTL